MIKGLNRLSTLKSLLVDRENIKGLCVGCLSSTSVNGLCCSCEADLPVNRWHCHCCALPLAFSGADLLCGDCLTSPPPFDRSLIPWRYQYPVDSMISRYKYNGQRKFARPLVTGFSDYLQSAFEGCSDAKPDILIPSPMLPARRRKRGFNQARDIAESLGQALSIPVDAGVVRRIRKVQSQRGLSREARLANLRGVFKVCAAVPERVAIVDDVVTTGATMRLLASALREAGAQEIQVWALARTPG
ncbi:comF family protein [Marinobacter antarcticus]|uniref:ComF family protein n=2 Tax=Marinobacter antarcticus TaxID=564117 RepID=A0A1M6RPQ7_9GAMM|nr:comF family protein [Marinobacter antarcticus]